MEDNRVQFDEPQHTVTKQQVGRKSFVDFLVDKGLAKNKQQATYILFGVIGVCILIIFLIFAMGGSDYATPNTFVPAEL